MAGRIEVLRNGQRVCIAGIDSDGVLCAIVNHVKHASRQPKYGLSITGLGKYHPADNQSQHVSWPAPGVEIGDEITIRIMQPGAFDPPEGMLPSPSSTIDDPLFGRLRYHINVWVGKVPYSKSPFEIADVNLVAPESGPLESQRVAFREFVDRHVELWPSVARALVRCHAGVASVAELQDRLNPRIQFIMQHEDGRVSVRYSINGEQGERVVVITFRNWEIAEVYALD
ncbi:MAG: hypothetical protein H6821_01000 [Planctomycetaceae bacterium]|nr:hypothetical protein [Planctomycetales bacterium]MCB9872728.1 hypothetical protein [Planctomycetaceae bacterium]MCB9926214.1 hypothetical protein [Planctomycetaceae bacterium]